MENGLSKLKKNVIKSKKQQKVIRFKNTHTNQDQTQNNTL